jgi:hypothetical protein
MTWDEHTPHVSHDHGTMDTGLGTGQIDLYFSQFEIV